MSQLRDSQKEEEIKVLVVLWPKEMRKEGVAFVQVKLSVRDSSLTPSLREKSLCGRRAQEPKGKWDLFCKLFPDSDSEVGFQRFLTFQFLDTNMSCIGTRSHRRGDLHGLHVTRRRRLRLHVLWQVGDQDNLHLDQKETNMKMLVLTRRLRRRRKCLVWQGDRGSVWSD